MRCWTRKNRWPKRCSSEEPAINELQIEIDDRVVQLLALHQLMAADLRFVLAVARINNDLERIGDQAVNIAQSAHAHPAPSARQALRRPAAHERTGRRHGARQPECRRPPATSRLARSVLVRDDQVDNLRDQIFRELLSYMMGDSSVVFQAFELILVAKNLERVADHATNIAEDVIYMVEGHDVRHSAADRR